VAGFHKLTWRLADSTPWNADTVIVCCLSWLTSEYGGTEYEKAELTICQRCHRSKHIPKFDQWHLGVFWDDWPSLFINVDLVWDAFIVTLLGQVIATSALVIVITCFVQNILGVRRLAGVNQHTALLEDVSELLIPGLPYLIPLLCKHAAELLRTQGRRFESHGELSLHLAVE
jgi:hypothetical protein